MKRIAVLGSTGSIGRQTLDIARQHPDRLEVVALAAGSNADALRAQGAEWPEARLALYAPHAEIPSGMDAIVAMAVADDVDLVVVAVAGVIGLLPTIEAIQAGKQIALASKEVLVAAGEVVMPLAREHGTVFTPIDSEHSAVFQCLQGARPGDVDELILTASGGPFRGWSREQLETVTVEDALNHPTWRMGGKITIDSATLMNKGLEMIEARWLFDVPVDRVKVVVHPQSVVHSLVRMKDGSALAQMGWPDMRLPIQIALLHPERKPNSLPPWSPLDTPNLTFEPVDEHTFPALELARESVRRGGGTSCAFNAANEVAANAFLQGRARFVEIPRIVERTMERHEPCEVTLASLMETDRSARAYAEACLADAR